KGASPALYDCETGGGPANLARALWQPVRDVVIVAFVGDEDVHVEMRTGRVVEGAHGDRDLLAFHWVPEQGGSAGLAEASANPFAGPVPGQRVLAFDRQRGFWNVR